ncbi:hypothetical protein [Rhizobium sp. Leaf341]|uniref:hypothetical protein n=1 Tax=Rhizobium sp. Leaf341 TaxID=1736344 RepID=UPI0007871FAA|nr:hypothetical protein [Rhizobium sp. Leaf341]
MSRDLANMLVEAIRQDSLVDGDTVPQPDLADAYAVQSMVLEQLGIAPKGCKLSLRGDSVLSAPLLSVTEHAHFPYQPGLKLEVEIALVLGRDVPVRAQSYHRQDIRDAIAEVRLGVEFVRSRYLGGPQNRTGLLVADLMSNAGYRLGPPLDVDVLTEGRQADPLRVTEGTQPLFDALARHPDIDPLAALVVYANEADRPADSLRQGSVVTTGSLCGGLPLSGAGSVSILLGQHAWTLEITG